jgi:plastin-1
LTVNVDLPAPARFNLRGGALTRAKESTMAASEASFPSEPLVAAGISEDKHELVKTTFARFDKDGSRTIADWELREVLKALGEDLTDEQCRDMIKSVDHDKDGVVNWGEFCQVRSARLRALSRAVSTGFAPQMFGSATATRMRNAARKMATLTAVEGMTGKHTYADEEKIAFTEHFNHCFAADELYTADGTVPIDPATDGLFSAIHDGTMLSKLVNLAAPDTIDERTVNFPKAGKKLNPWEVKENMNLVINSAKSIGCSIVNVHAGDLSDAKTNHTEHIVLGLVWQLVKLQLLRAVNLREVPDIVVLLQEGEELADLKKLDPEVILLRWVNYHLSKVSAGFTVNNLSSDLSDGRAYVHLLHSIDPSSIALSVATDSDIVARATAVVRAAKDSLAVPAFVQPGDILRGHKRLNLAFCAQIFNIRHGLEAKEEDVSAAMEAAGLLEDDVEGEGREGKSYRMWLNSLNLGHGNPEGGHYIHSLDDAFSDGICLLEALDKVEPGCLEGIKYVKDPKKLNPFEKVANCNKVIDVCKRLGFSVMGLGGRDIADNNQKALLSIMSQLMRHQVISMLRKLGGGKPPKDAEIVAWANETVSASGASSTISTFRDSSISNGLFLLDLLSAINPRAVNKDLIAAGDSEDDKKNNARYIISVARKVGAQVFLSWEDIVEVKAKMIMVLVASIMTVAKTGDTAAASA